MSTAMLFAIRKEINNLPRKVYNDMDKWLDDVAEQANRIQEDAVEQFNLELIYSNETNTEYNREGYNLREWVFRLITNHRWRLEETTWGD